MPPFSSSVGERKLMTHFVVILDFSCLVTALLALGSLRSNFLFLVTASGRLQTY
jgi:hypothetical protein